MSSLSSRFTSFRFQTLCSQGNCEDDDDCKGDYVCFERSKGTAVPGCLDGENDNTNTNYCILPGSVLDFLGRNPSGTLDRCQGDCDKATQCRDDLVCYQKDKNEAVPVSLSLLFKYSPYDFETLTPFVLRKRDVPVGPATIPSLIIVSVVLISERSR